jgi:N-methylhydantoinase A
MLVSGPAAGVTGAIHQAVASGYRNVITLDMGGTSTDICLVNDAAAQIITGKLIDRLPVLAPMLDITAIGAGGGSIAWFDGAGIFQVGPRSAGAQPGPACYGRGGTVATLTDACVIMGLIRPDHFLGGTMSLDVAAAHRAMLPVAERLGFDIEQAAEGMFRIACANMLQATRQVSIERGYDPRDYAIVAYGGAGPLHAVVLAEEIGAKAVIVPPNPGVTSAMGLLLADFRLDYVRSRMLRLEESNRAIIGALFAEMRAAAQADLEAMAPPGQDAVRYSIDLRYVGQGYELSLDVEPFNADGSVAADFLDTAAQRFHALHHRRMGHSYPQQAVRAISYRTRLVVPQTPFVPGRKAAPAAPAAPEHGTIRWNGARLPASMVQRADLAEAARVTGPALIEDGSASTFIPPGWIARVDGQDALIIERA